MISSAVGDEASARGALRSGHKNFYIYDNIQAIVGRLKGSTVNLHLPVGYAENYEAYSVMIDCGCNEDTIKKALEFSRISVVISEGDGIDAAVSSAEALCGVQVKFIVKGRSDAAAIIAELRSRYPAYSIAAEAEGDQGAELAKIGANEIITGKSPNGMMTKLIKAGFIPGICIACALEGRDGRECLELRRDGRLSEICYLNSLLSLKEHIEDHHDMELRICGTDLVLKELYSIENKELRSLMTGAVKDIRSGARNLHV